MAATKGLSQSGQGRPKRSDVIAAIGAAGYPLELRVARAVELSRFSPMPSWTWWDPRQTTERELDVAATLMSLGEGATVGLHVLMECKRFGDGVVVFEPRTPEPTEAFRSLHDAHCWGQPSAVISRPGAVGGSLLLDAFGWTAKHWAPAATVVYQYGVLYRQKHSGTGKAPAWRVDHQDVHVSIDGLCRALLSYREEIGIVAPEFRDPFVNFAALLVVVEGPLYRYRVGGGGVRAGVKAIDRATYYRRGFTSAGRRVDYRIDFVRERALPPLLNDLRASADQILAVATAKSALMRESIEKFGNTRDRHPG